MAELRSLGYELIPSDAAVFMPKVKRGVTLMGEEFRKRLVLGFAQK